MTERSLLNVANKVLGTFMVIQGVSGLVWAFLASRYTSLQSEAADGVYGALFIVIGLLLCGRSSYVTRFLFRLDGPLDEHSLDDAKAGTLQKSPP